MVRKLSAKEAISRSRSDFFSFSTILTSQREGERRIGLGLRRVRPAAGWPRRSRPRQAQFVDRDRRIGLRRARVLDEDDLVLPGSTPVSRPAVPSLNSRTTGPVLLRCIRWRQRSRSARDHMPEFCAQAESAAASGTVSPGRCGIRPGRAPGRNSGPPSSSPAGADGSGPRLPPCAGADTPAPDVPPPLRLPGNRRGRAAIPEWPGVCPSDISTSEPF